MPHILSKRLCNAWQQFQEYYLEELHLEHQKVTKSAVQPQAADTSSAPDIYLGQLVRLLYIVDPAVQGTYVQLTKQLGQGGFGSVYAGVVVYLQPDHHGQIITVSTGKFVAVKVYHRVMSGVPEALLQQLVSKEFEAMQLLNSQPYATKLLAYGELEAEVPSSQPVSFRSVQASEQHITTCAILELLPNTLHRTLSYTATLTEDEAKVIIRQLTEQLSVMHSCDLGKIVIHCDIKPENLMLRMNGEVVLGDFGACVLGAASAGHQQTAAAAVAANPQHLIITHYYGAPEVYKLVAKALKEMKAGSQDTAADIMSASQPPAVFIDTSVDVFSVGVLVLRMLTGPLEQLIDFIHQPMKTAERWEQVLAAIVDREVLMPDGVLLSDAALQFVGCACGVGHDRELAEQQGKPKRLSAAQLLSLPWLQ